jgi:hypothetical protein
LGDFVVHLMSCEVEGAVNDVFTQSTLDLIGLCFASVYFLLSLISINIKTVLRSELLKNCNLHSNALFKVTSSFSRCPVFLGTSEGYPTLQSQVIANLLNEVTKIKDSSGYCCELEMMKCC